MALDTSNKIMFPNSGPEWDLATGIPNLTGKVAVVTGANSATGIGYNIAHQLAIKGARVYVSARSVEKAEGAIAKMKHDTPALRDDQLHPLVLDLSDLKQAQAAAKKLLDTESRLDIVVNNAAMMATPFKKDTYGVSDSFTTNYLGPYVFTTTLLPLLKKTSEVHPDVRVVNVTSTVHCLVPVDVKLGSVEDFNQLLGGADDFQSNLARYGLSKLANILFTKQLQIVFNEQGINGVVLATHPGGVATDGSLKWAGTDPALLEKIQEGLSPLQGSLVELFAATNPVVSEEKEKYGGAYLVPFGIEGQTTEAAQNKELARQLWKASEEFVRKVLA